MNGGALVTVLLALVFLLAVAWFLLVGGVDLMLGDGLQW